MPADKMKSTILLCDGAQEANGKLYILGGGWSIVHSTPVTMALAVRISVPWEEANRRHVFVATLLTEDGFSPTLLLPPAGTEQQQTIEARGEFEVGRPVGLKSGTSLDTALAITFANVPLRPGGYVWKFSINAEPMEDIPFTVLSA